MSTLDAVLLAKFREALSIIYYDPETHLEDGVWDLVEKLKDELNEAYFTRYMDS